MTTGARRGQRFAHLAEGVEARVVRAEAGGEVDLPHRAEDLLGLARRVGGAEHLQVLGRHQRALRAAAVGGAEGQGADPLRVGERQLLGDHPAHRDADDVGALDLERVEQRQRVAGHVGDRERQLGPAREPHAAVVEDDARRSSRSSAARNAPPQARWVALIPWISSIGSPSPARS